MLSAARAYIDSWRQMNSAERVRWWCRALSFSAIWLWCSLLARSDVLSATVVASLRFETADIPLLASNVAVLFVLVLIAKRLSSLLDSKRVFIADTVLLSVGSLFVVMGQEYANTVVCYLGVIMGGAAIAFLKISWGEMYSRTRLNEGLMIMGASLLVAMVAILISTVLTNALIEVLLVISGVSCAPLLRFGTQGSNYSMEEIKRKPRNTLKSSWTFLALPALVALTFGASHGATAMSADELTGLEPLIAPVGTGVSGAILMLVALRSESRFSAARIYAWALVLVVLGYVLMVLSLLPPVFANMVLLTGFLIFYFFMIVFWGSLAKRMRHSVLFTYLVGYLVFQFAQLVGDSLSLYLLSTLSADDAIVFSTCIILAFFACVLFLYGSVNSPFRVWLMADSPQETSDDISNACILITTKRSLTPREHEILTLLVRGRNTAHIVQMQNITRDTVKTHVKNIYRKLDVHSHQELLDLVDRVIEEGLC